MLSVTYNHTQHKYRMLNSPTSPERARLAGEVVDAPVRGQMDTDHIRERPICCENS